MKVRIAIEQISDEQEAVDAALRSAGPGDLLVLFADSLRRTWDQIVDFEPASEAPRAAPPASPAAALPDLPVEDVGEGLEVIRDERGVRLAREIED